MTVETVQRQRARGRRLGHGGGAIGEGIITVDKASGRVNATTVNEGIRLTNVTGDMSAETTNGDIVIENAQSSSLEASTVNGDITFNGAVRDNGAYRLTTHGGDVRVGLGGATNATVFVRTFQGDFGSDFPIQLPEGQSARSGSKRFNFTLGNGSARIDVQSFNGDIFLARKTILSKEDERAQRRKLVQPPQPPQPPQGPQPPKPPKHFEYAWPSSDEDREAWLEIQQEIQQKIQHTIQHEIQMDVQMKIQDEVQREVQKEVQSEVQKDVQKEVQKNVEKAVMKLRRIGQ